MTHPTRIICSGVLLTQVGFRSFLNLGIEILIKFHLFSLLIQGPLFYLDTPIWLLKISISHAHVPISINHSENLWVVGFL